MRSSRPLATTRFVIFLIEGLNSFATVFYLYNLYFFTEKTFGFGNTQNLALAALNGFFNMVVSWVGGRFADRYGYYHALKLGVSLMAAALLTGCLPLPAYGYVILMCAMVSGMCFTWPTLEALTALFASQTELPRQLGIYNVTWAAGGAAAYFLGGAIMQRFGLHSIFYVPVIILAVEFVLILWLQAGPSPNHVRAGAHEIASDHAPARDGSFLKMAWLANPLAYVAINTLVAMMPRVALRFHWSTAETGFMASLWCFARMGAFFLFWKWQGWHYRFGWLLGMFVAMMLTFTIILTTDFVLILVLAQLVFGVSLGLIYYSSLFYSMDLGDTKGEHGGIHEAAIGLGNCAGPGAAALAILVAGNRQMPGVLTVGSILACGALGLILLRRKSFSPKRG